MNSKWIDPSLRLLEKEELATITGGMTPAAGWKIWSTTTKMGSGAVDEQPAFIAKQKAAKLEACTAAVNQFKAANPNWQSIVQPSPFAARPHVVPPGLLKPRPLPTFKQGK